MGVLTTDGVAGGLMKYTDDDSNYIKIVISQIASYNPVGLNSIHLEMTNGPVKLVLNDQIAVTNAIAILDSKF